MALDRQVHIYAVDTAAFYTEQERDIDERLRRAGRAKARHERARRILRAFERGRYTERRALEKLERVYGHAMFLLPEAEELEEAIAACRADIGREKRALRAALAAHDGMRALPAGREREENVISIFESSLTRTLSLRTNEITDALILVRVYYFEVFRDLVLHGFTVDGKRYVVLTASAGQIRTKKCLFIRESLLQRHGDTILCGLSAARINRLGGCNPNKYLSYLALCNSATEPWPDFDVGRAIVVDDMAFPVRGVVDAIDDTTYAIRRQEMDVPLNHTDGCGMILPQLTGGKNLMIRLPWIKGLLAAFPFDTFLRERCPDGCLVRDIYGTAHDVLAEGIQVIFTRSQFKMWQFYADWAEYQRCFRVHGCEAGICNVEEDTIPQASIGYQMLQSLTGLTDAELLRLSARTRYRLEHLSTDRRTMLRCLGATAGNPNRTAAQEALRLYPELLQDVYFREELRGMKRALERQAWAGKLEIAARYLYVIPDLYAFCEWLFLGAREPAGLLQNGEVYTAQFPAGQKLDCLRSPSLYREHPVRQNVADPSACRRWFSARGVYTSCHDLIGRMLQFDNDGDKLLVCAERTLVEAAERHMADVVPLYYPMKKAAPRPLTPQAIYEGMTAAYRGGNIGPISNSISKIWNRPEPDLDAIKWLCYRTNERIDYAKTLYQSTPPAAVARRLRAAAAGPLPHFFAYVKDKPEERLAPRGNSPVDRLRTLIPSYRFDHLRRSGSRFDYRMLLHDPAREWTEADDRIAARYHAACRALHAGQENGEDGLDAYSYRFQRLREEMLSLGEDPNAVVDAIIHDLFGVRRSRRKRAFWGALGDFAVENLRQNLERRRGTHTVCGFCLSYFEKTDAKATCPVCGRRNATLRTAQCADCGETFAVDARNTRKTRCDRCQAEADRAHTRARVQRCRDRR